MEIFLNIVFLLAIFGLGGAIGAYIVVSYLEKNTLDLIKSYKKLINVYKNMVFLDTRLIRAIYTDLIKLRDSGTENLDELIGYLGEALDDHSEEDSNATDSDRQITGQEG